MATSRRAGFWASPIGRWIESGKNIVGSVLAAAALAAQAIVGLGAWWPVVVVASYIVGALVAPRGRVDLRRGLEPGRAITGPELIAELKQLRHSIAGESRRLPDDANELATSILDALDEIVARWDDLTGSADQSHVVEQMILDYLPTSVQTYLNLPRTFALASRVEGKKTARDELVEQLTILQKESDRIRTAVYAKDLDALGDQSRFLRDKFGRSSLEL
ncbi:hypothetical protein BH09ACT6_BH09ACT6_03190 [soil metagenome]